MKELPVPPAAHRDPKAIELLRVWAAEKQQHVSIATGLWDDPAAWGIALVHLARHIARSYELAEARDPAEVLARIREGFDAEWESSNDSSAGELLD